MRTICIGDMEAQTFSCDYCDSTFLRNHDLKRHKLNRHNKDGSAKFQCSICDVEFCNRKLLMVHNKEAHPMNIENSCKAVKVLNEVKEDEGTMTYECEYCGKRFEREDSVMKHKVTHNVVAVTCKECGKIFCNKKSYAEHMENLHPLSLN